MELMMLGPRFALLAVATAALFSVSAKGCESLPSSPVLAPDKTESVGPPDAEGNVYVTGPEGTANGENDVVLVFDNTTGKGVMQEAERDGSFEVAIEANAGDTLVIRLMRAENLSDEVYRRVNAQ